MSSWNGAPITTSSKTQQAPSGLVSDIAGCPTMSPPLIQLSFSPLRKPGVIRSHRKTCTLSITSR